MKEPLKDIYKVEVPEGLTAAAQVSLQQKTQVS